MGNKNDRWSALSMSDRADLIKLYVSNGITSLNDIKKDYNSFGPGGHIETDEYGYPADITPAVIVEEYPKTTKFFEDFANRYNTFHNTDATDTILKTIKEDIPVVKTKGFSMYNPLTDKIYLRTQNPVTYTHELTHKLNDSFPRRIKRTEEELQILKDAYPLGGKDTHGKLYEMLISDREYFTTNTELRRRISEVDGNVLGEELNSVINSMSDEELAELAGNSGYSSHNDFYKYKDSIKTGKDLYEALIEGKENEKAYEDLSDRLKAFYQHSYESGTSKNSNAGEPNSELLNKVREALIRVAQNTTNENRLDYVNPDNIAAFGGKLNLFGPGGPKDSKHVEDVVRTTRGSTGKIFTWDFPFVDVMGAKHLFDSWRVMHGNDKKVAPSDNNYTGTAIKGVGVQTDDGLGFASQQDLANILGYTPKDFVDTYVYGDTPFEELGVFKKESSPERHVVRSKVKKVEDSGRKLNTYQTQRDTLDTDTVAALDSLLNAGLVDLHSKNTTYQKSPFNIGDSGIIYDGNNSTIATAYLPNGMPVSKAIDVFDTDPKEWNYKVGPLAKTGLGFIHDNTNPFLMTTPWYYPIKSSDFLSRLHYLFGIEADRDYNVLSNKGDKNGVIWSLHEALEWLDSHPDLTEMPVKTKKD